MSSRVRLACVGCGTGPDRILSMPIERREA